MKALRKLKISGILEVILWGIGFVCLAFTFTQRVKANAAQRAADSISTKLESDLHDTSSRDQQVMGRLDIPAIHLSVPILDNYDPASLRSGVGHIRGSAMPGGLGNLGLAGHRDTYFRPLRHIERGMEIDVATTTANYRYFVDSMKIVAPEQVEVLDIAEHPSMTLITCYPFDFVGAAPQRFIVQAHLLSVSPSSTR